MITIENAFAAVMSEYKWAVENYHKFNGPHEGYAIMLEEFDEFWTEVKRNDADRATLECVQVAAMCFRWLLECGDVDTITNFLSKARRKK